MKAREREREKAGAWGRCGVGARVKECTNKNISKNKGKKNKT